jgi:hypothetical protein
MGPPPTSLGLVDRSRKIGMEFSGQGIGLREEELSGFLVWVPAHFRLRVQVVLLDTKLEGPPFFAARVVFRIFYRQAGKEVRLARIMRELSDSFL